jgi:hypothetical protein
VSKIQEVNEFNTEPSKLLTTVRSVTFSLGWKVTLEELNQITVREALNNAIDLPGGSTLAISVEALGTGSKMTIDGSNFGMGPIQKNLLKQQMGRFMMALKNALESTDASSSSNAVNSSGSVADELKKLADLHAQGLLSDGEFANAKAKLLD